MFKKKYILILLLLIVNICAIPAISATADFNSTSTSNEITTDNMATTNENNNPLTNDEITTNIATKNKNTDPITNDEITTDNIATKENKPITTVKSSPLDITASFENEATVNSNDNDNQDILSSKNDNVISQDASKNVLSTYDNVLFINYEIDLQDTYEISGKDGGTISYYRKPFTNTNWKAYNYKFYVYQGTDIVYQSANIIGDKPRTAGTCTYTFDKNVLRPGIYLLLAVNNFDSKVMDGAILNVKGIEVITANDYAATYNSNTPMHARVTDIYTGLPLIGVSVKVEFSNGVTNYYTTNYNGEISFVPSFKVGKYTATFSSNVGHISAEPIQKTITITKASTTIKAKNVVEYKGFKTTLKATVKSNGKNVNEGTVSFRINGKTYKAAVKNGVATKKIKLKKIKKYTYTAQYNGNTNLIKSKKFKRKATLKKRLATKIVAKNQKVNTVQTKFFNVKILTKSGKKVKGGKLKIVGKATPQPVKNGKAKLIKYGTVSMLFKGSNGYIYKYKKSITKTYKIKYIPASHKYKASTKKIKITLTYKCPVCGKTKTHYHYHRGYYTLYKTKIVVS